MTPDQITLLINGGIAGIFAVFAIRLYILTLKAISEQNDRLDRFLESERKQRNTIMEHATKELERLTEIVKTAVDRIGDISDEDDRK